MVFALMGTTTEGGLRRFTFELAGSGPPRTTVVVVADMALVRKYEIPLQELPLLCLRLLESRTADAEGPAVFPEQEMIEYADRRRASKELAEQKRRMYRAAQPSSAEDA
ncbi:MAG TPA: hypothetical protein VEV85_07620 [Bryobacteraceae bacterium]|nr:hypothetical protein [Bryobacteraceae bacterium]